MIITLIVILSLFISLCFLLVVLDLKHKYGRMEQSLQRKQIVAKLLEEKVKTLNYTLRIQKKQINLMEEFLGDVADEAEFVLKESVIRRTENFFGAIQEVNPTEEIGNSENINILLTTLLEELKAIRVFSKKDFAYSAVIEKYFSKPESNKEAIASLEEEAAAYEAEDNAYDTAEVEKE